MPSTDLDTRRHLALAAIRAAFGTPAGRSNVTLFVEHHLDELPPAYWRQHLGVDKPEPAAVLGLLAFKSSWGERDQQSFDFTLPDGVTDYVVSVRFDAAGQVDGLSMES